MFIRFFVQNRLRGWKVFESLSLEKFTFDVFVIETNFHLIEHFENCFFRSCVFRKKSFVVTERNVDVGAEQSLDNFSVT